MTTALITGASAGLGEAFARRLAASGHDLVVVARSEDVLTGLAAELTARHGVQIEVVVADLADPGDVDRVADRLRDPGRPVDLLINNAGFGLGARFVGGDLADQVRILDVMCRAVLVLSHAVLPGMRDRGRGAVLNVSSIAGFTAMGTYAAAKSWVTTFTEGLAVELRGTGVLVTALCPGFVRTQFHVRESIRTDHLPDAAWLRADDVVDTALRDLRAGRVLSVPSARYAVVAGVARTAPRWLVRAASGGLARGRRR